MAAPGEALVGARAGDGRDLLRAAESRFQGLALRASGAVHPNGAVRHRKRLCTEPMSGAKNPEAREIR